MKPLFLMTLVLLVLNTGCKTLPLNQSVGAGWTEARVDNIIYTAFKAYNEKYPPAPGQSPESRAREIDTYKVCSFLGAVLISKGYPFIVKIRPVGDNYHVLMVMLPNGKYKTYQPVPRFIQRV